MANPTNEKELNKQNKWEGWEKTREKGTFQFVIVHGCFIWGGIMSVLFWLFQYFRSSDSYLNEVFFKPGYQVMFFLSWLCIGFLYGITTWFFSESAYQRSRKNKDFNIWIPKQKNIENPN